MTTGGAFTDSPHGQPAGLNNTNFAGWQSDTVNDLLVKARSVVDPAERAALYRKAEEGIAAEQPMLFVHFDATIQAASSKLDWIQYADGAFRLQFAKLG